MKTYARQISLSGTWKFRTDSDGMGDQKFTIELEQEQDQRWIAEVLELPGAMAYGSTPDNAKAKAQALALGVLADRLEHGEPVPVAR